MKCRQIVYFRAVRAEGTQNPPRIVLVETRQMSRINLEVFQITTDDRLGLDERGKESFRRVDRNEIFCGDGRGRGAPGCRP